MMSLLSEKIAKMINFTQVQPFLTVDTVVKNALFTNAAVGNGATDTCWGR